MMRMHEGQLFMVYQPKITAGTNELSGFEALITLGASEIRYVIASNFHPNSRTKQSNGRSNELDNRASLQPDCRVEKNGLPNTARFN